MEKDSHLFASYSTSAVRQTIANSRGQVAIFAALIFMVLFCFFALVISVGLAVHHKINLQNSVDIAAYYGAQKQAEVLNAIAHSNYQIRQSWKLMSYRYRAIGMGGNHVGDSVFDTATETINPGNDVDSAYPCEASFCVNYDLFEIMNKDEGYCKDMCNGSKITLPGQPFGASLVSGLMAPALPGLAAAIDAATNVSRGKITNACKERSALSWLVLGRFIFSFKNDFANRKKVINKLANGISYDTSDMLDLDGQSVRAGTLQTLWKNLTFQNQASLDPKTGTGEGSFEFYNGLGAGPCSGTRDSVDTPPKWLSEIFVKPLYSFLDGICDGSQKVEFVLRPLNLADKDQSLPYHQDKLDPNVVKFIREYALDPLTFDSGMSRLFHTTVGYEKNPWCAAYVKVSAKTKPDIPFLPFGKVTFSATAYAKPFGGKIGPWFYKTWPQSSDQSIGTSAADQVDSVLPPRVRSGELPAGDSKDFLKVDYSRYTGDQVGIKSRLTMSRQINGNYKLHSKLQNPPNQINLTWWSHLMNETADISSLASHGDILAWDSEKNKAPPIRSAEIAAVIPDQFDLTYYSIEPFWWRTYAQRIQKRSDFKDLQVRGDLGFRKGGEGSLASYSVKDQMAAALQADTFDFNNSLTYVAGREQSPTKAFTELLTGWHNKAPGDYNLEPNRFGKCYEGGIIQGGPEDLMMAAPGNCSAGGRVGYAVKLVDPTHLSEDQEIGGAGQTGKIKNPPPQ